MQPIAPATIAAQVKDRTRRIIRADGSIEPVDRRLRIGEIERRIGCATTDTVNLHHLGHPLMVMFVDDIGYEVEVVDLGERHIEGLGRANVTERRPTKARKPVNEIATALYHANCHPGVTHQIVGDVYVCPDEDFA